MLKRIHLIVALFLLPLLFSSSTSHSAPRWRADYFPNVPLITQEGKALTFYDDVIKDKVVAISFIFTRCNGPCPAETARLRQVEKLLGDAMGKSVFFYSISIDPEHDTPERLQEYARKFNAGPGWTFLTGKRSDIQLIRKKLGVYTDDDFKVNSTEEEISDHNVSFVVGNEATGQWIRRSPFDHPKVLARLLGVSLQRLPVASSGAGNYARAPGLPKFTRGESLFRSRCSSCHSLGSEDSLGPGLAGVVKKRERSWLTRWLKTPDQMLAEKDPIATAQLAKYSNLAMPNLQLSDVDVEELIRFLGAY